MQKSWQFFKSKLKNDSNNIWMRIHFRISRYRFYHIIAQNPLRVRPFIKFIFMRDFLRKIHFNNNFIQAGIKSIFKLEFNKLFYYWQLINQWKSIALPIYNIFFCAASDKNRLCFLSIFFSAAGGEHIKNEIHIIGYQSKKQKKRLTGIIVEEGWWIIQGL